MKKIFFVAMALLCTYATNCTAGKPPSAVIAAFNQKFPNATNVKWEKENRHEYEAEFTWQNKNLSANFNDTGAWLETESPISFSLLPEKVRSAFNVSHPGATLKAVAQIEYSDGSIKYEVELKKGAKTIELFYNENGAEVKG